MESKKQDKQPIKRSAELVGLSREHHHTLLLCWKIKNGIKKEIEPTRIKKYMDWFAPIYIKPHFDAEEQFLFSLFSPEHQLIKDAIKEHKEIYELLAIQNPTKEQLLEFAKKLDDHVRFEERVLFGELEKAASPEQMKQFAEQHEEIKFVENNEDEFWK